MESIEIGGMLKAITPIHHGSDENTGNQSTLRRIKYIVDGKIIDMPYIDGNAIRGMLRRLVASDFLDTINHEVDTKQYHLLFSGGMLESVESSQQGKIDLELRRRIRERIIPLSLFGCSIGNQMLSGKILVGKCLPACKEMNSFIPIHNENRIHTFLDWTYNTRKDDLHDGDETVQMKYGQEVFIPGTVFYHWFTLNDMTDMEKCCFNRMIKLWKSYPYVGGKLATGHGKIELGYQSLEGYDSRKYVHLLKKNSKRIVEVLDEL